MRISRRGDLRTALTAFIVSAGLCLSSGLAATASSAEDTDGAFRRVIVTADTTAQSWGSEKSEIHASKAYVAALGAPEWGRFTENFLSTDESDGTDAKLGLLSFDISSLRQAPDYARLRLTYLGYAGATRSAEESTRIIATAVDDTVCTNGAASCDPNEASWNHRPAIDLGDGRPVAQSEPVTVGSVKYSDTMTLPATPAVVELDVTASVREAVEAGRDTLTLALSETSGIDMRFASLEGAARLSGATAAIAPSLLLPLRSHTQATRRLVVTGLQQRYSVGEAFSAAGMRVFVEKTDDASQVELASDAYELTGTDYDVNAVGAHELTVTSKEDPELSTTVLVYVSAPGSEAETPGPSNGEDVLWYAQPASSTPLRGAAGVVGQGTDNVWQQTTLPIGNGRLGASVWGEIGTEHLTLNEETLWTGGPGSSPNYRGGNEEGQGRHGATLRELNKQLEQGANTVNPHGLTGGYDARQQGSYQSWGHLYMDSGISGEVSDYERYLNLSRGRAGVSFTHEGVAHSRDYFVSQPDKVLVSRISANKEGAVNLRLRIPTHEGFTKRGEKTVVSADTITVTGALANNGLRYAMSLKAISDSGEISTNEDGTELLITGAQHVTLYLAAATDYQQTYPTYRTGESAAALRERVATTVQAAATKGYAAVLRDHEADHRALYDRVSLDLGQSPSYGEASLPSNELLAGYQEGSAAHKRSVENLAYQYGRYLTIASSREDSQLPANLQGIWSSTADDNAHGRTPWGSDFHMNVNLQMNYWPTYSANLGELATPLLAYAHGLVEPGRVTAEVYAGAHTEAGTPVGEGRGYMAHTENTPYGWTTPGAAFSWGWSPAAVPWLLQNVYESYEFSGDEAALREKIYPLLKEQAHFYTEYMLHPAARPAADGSTRLTTGVAYSPEHGPQGTDGNTYESSLVWQLLHDTIEAAEILGVDADLVGSQSGSACEASQWQRDDDGAFLSADAPRTWSCAMSLLKPVEVGSEGQIKEWYSEDALGKSANGEWIDGYQRDHQHRHLSHLLGLYPGDLMTIDNPTYLEAAQTSLRRRGDQATGWGLAQRFNSWARTGDGDHAYALLSHQLDAAMYPNFFDAHPPFQIDGNFGYTSGVNEMLLQSNSTFTDNTGKEWKNYTHILPALPQAWQETGSVRGLVARGGFVTNIDWAMGAVETATLTSRNGAHAAVRISRGGAENYIVAAVSAPDGRRLPVKDEVKATWVKQGDDTLLTFPTKAGYTYTIVHRDSVPPTPEESEKPTEKPTEQLPVQPTEPTQPEQPGKSGDTGTGTFMPGQKPMPPAQAQSDAEHPTVWPVRPAPDGSILDGLSPHGSTKADRSGKSLHTAAPSARLPRTGINAIFVMLSVSALTVTGTLLRRRSRQA